MAGVRRAFSGARWSEVRRWDAGYGFADSAGRRPFAGRDVTYPRLEDVIEAFPGVPLNVDLKAPVADLAVSLIRRMGAEARVCLASFQYKTMRRVRELGYAGPTALSRWEALLFVVLPAALQRGPLRPRATAAQLPLSLARPWVVARCRRLGLSVDFWTVNDPALVGGLVALGVDGIMTDDPARIAPALRAALGGAG
jgi:glycerophosphoryl diester phosphodiesterase